MRSPNHRADYMRRRTRSPAGKGAAPQGRDDVANACAGVRSQLLLDRRPALVRPKSPYTGPAHSGTPFPKFRNSGIFATICTAKDGSAATIFGLKTQDGLLILDFNVGFYDAYLFLATAVRLFELSAMIPLAVSMATYAMQFGVRDINPAIFCSASLAAQATGVTVSGANTCDIRNLPETDINLMVPAAVRHIGAGRVQLNPGL